jgi:pimeloyl-ACP methyl ester carboxylesterase
MFFVHGWPDSGAEFAAQFGHFCFGPDAKYHCVAATWQNFHPDLPDAPEADLDFAITFDKLAATMKECDLLDTTFIIHDWGSFIGYEMLNKYPELMQRTVSFDIGTGGHPNVTYQAVNVQAFQTKNSQLSENSANYWEAPCPHCATWRTAWPYVYNLSMRGVTPMPPPGDKPLLFMWGNMTRGKPREADSIFFDANWTKFVKSCPHGRVVEGPGDHWMFHESAKFVNDQITDWLESLPV